MFCTAPRKSHNDIQMFITDCIVVHFVAATYKLFVKHGKSSIGRLHLNGSEDNSSAGNLLPKTNKYFCCLVFLSRFSFSVFLSFLYKIDIKPFKKFQQKVKLLLVGTELTAPTISGLEDRSPFHSATQTCVE